MPHENLPPPPPTPPQEKHWECHIVKRILIKKTNRIQKYVKNVDIPLF